MHIIDMRMEEKQGDTPHSEMDLGRHQDSEETGSR